MRAFRSWRRRTTRRLARFLLLLVVLAVASAIVRNLTGTTSWTTAPATAADGPVGADGPYRVVRDIDGDTIVVDVAGVPTTVRLIGIDTPETKKPGTPVQCYGPEASAYTAALVDGRQVWLQRDPTQDQVDVYGRTLAYVWLDTGTMLETQLLAGGYAREYTYDRAYLERSDFRRLEHDAKTRGAGLWGACPATS